MSSRYQKAFTIPDGFPAILKAFTREVRSHAHTGEIHDNVLPAGKRLSTARILQLSSF